MGEMVPGTTIPKPKVKLVGRDGNAFAILGFCKRALNEARVPKPVVDAFFAEAMAGDYDHLLATAAKYCDVR